MRRYAVVLSEHPGLVISSLGMFWEAAAGVTGFVALVGLLWRLGLRAHRRARVGAEWVAAADEAQGYRDGDRDDGRYGSDGC